MIPGSAISLLLATAGPAFNPRDFMDVKLYTGNGSTQTISGLGFSPDLVWVKIRSGTGRHTLEDTVRGATKNLFTNETFAEETDANSITAFTSDGFSLGNNTTGSSNVNVNSSTYVAWTWDAGDSTDTNTQGSITSQVRANASAGFSIISYTGNGSAGATIGHSLGVAPAFAIFKNRSVSSDWQIYHASLGNAQSILLQSTAAAGGTSSFNSTSPTSTLITLGVAASLNISGSSHICYAFAPVAGYSSFGSYTGNGSATGPVISGLGFQPFFVMIKASSTTGDWWMYDGARSPSNPRINKLKANTGGAEDTAGEDVDFQSDGFQIKTSDSGLNQNAATYIYAAFA